MIVGRGHAPEMICLFGAERNVLIAGDQVLPRISPNVSVWPSEPAANPLAEFLSSLARFRELPEDCLVLPSHGPPFRGLRARIDQLVAHHEERLAATLDACSAPATVVEVIPKLFDRPLDGHQLQFALGESLAHLNYLVDRGELLAQLDRDGRAAVSEALRAPTRSRPRLLALALLILVVDQAAGCARQRADRRAGCPTAGQRADDGAAGCADRRAPDGPSPRVRIHALAPAEQKRSGQSQWDGHLTHRVAP